MQEEKVKIRCLQENCRQRLGLMSFKCSACERLFCVKHRLPEDHECVRDYKQMARLNLQQKMAKDTFADTHHYVKLH